MRVPPLFLFLTAPDAIIGAVHDDVSGLAVSGVDLGDDLPILGSLAGLVSGFVDFHFLFLLLFLGGFPVPLSTVYIIQHIAIYVNRFRANVNVKCICTYTVRRQKVV